MASGPVTPRGQQANVNTRQINYPNQVARNVAEAKVGLVSQLERGAERRLKL